MRKWLENQPAPERAYYEKMVEMFGIGSTRMAFVRRESIRNQFYSDLATPLEDHISAPGTTVHIFYAVKMGEQYEARYRKHFQNPDIRRHEMQHEELLVCYPQRWAEEIRACYGLNVNESMDLWYIFSPEIGCEQDGQGKYLGGIE